MVFTRNDWALASGHSWFRMMLSQYHHWAWRHARPLWLISHHVHYWAWNRHFYASPWLSGKLGWFACLLERTMGVDVSIYDH